MVRLVYSNRTEELLTELGTRVRAQQARDGALLPVRIVVPGRSLETHVRLGVAREQGIAANLDVQLLTRFAASVAAPPGERIADANAISAMALQLLLDDAMLSVPELAPVLGYLRAAGESADAMDLRRVQLAARLGRIFEEYTYSRGEMLAAWKTGPVHDASRAEVERWQRRFWLAMFGADGLARRRSPRLHPLHEAVETMAPAVEASPSAVHVFGFAHVARTFHELLARLGRTTEVVIYTLSPCEGFWEDVDPRDPPLLSLWARPGRENVRALNALAGFDHDDRFVDPEGPTPTLLRSLQGDLLHRRATPLAPLAPDASFAVLEHASIRRECEAVASSVWQAVREDPTLPFDAITVLVPQGEAATYAAHLSAAFHEAHDIPHQSLGLPDSTPGRIAGAIELLLALPLGRFTRPEVLEVLVHPSVVASVTRGEPDANPEQWLAWCESLGIVHGADHTDHERTYIEHDILNWDQGLRRLSLGAFMTGEASGELTPFVAGGEAYLPHELAGTELRDAATFGLLVRSLLADARFARHASLTPREWADFLTGMVETYVAPVDDAEADELARRLRQLGGLADVDLEGRKVGYRVASELSRARLAIHAGSRGGEGVLVSTVAAARGIPARVVFACGLGEGRFPSSDAEDPLDLRSLGARADRREGDVTARERDKYAFLEVLVGVRDRLVLSYVSRDPLTGDAISASSVVQELLHTLATAYSCPGEALRHRHPLRRWDPVYFPALFGREAGESAPLGTMELPEARAEAATLALRRSAERQSTRVALHDVVARADGGDPAWTSLAEHLRMARLPLAAPMTDARITVPMYALVKFLELPLQGWARFRLGLDERDAEDLAGRESEPFETAPRDETLLLRDVLLDAAARKQTVEEAYDTLARARELRGTGPSGVFARGERGDHLRALDVWREGLAQHHVSADDLQIHRFGRGGEHTRAHQVHEPLLVEVGVEDASGVLRVVRVEIGGRTVPVGGADRTSVVLAKRGNEAGHEWAVAGRRRSLLRAFVDYAVLAASGAEPGEGHASLLVVSTHDQPVIERVAFGPLTADAAKGWLRHLLAELLGAPHAYFFPCEAVFVHHARGPEAPVVPVLEEARDKLGGDGPPALRSAYGPVPRPQSYPLPGESAARGMIERRFDLLLAALPPAVRR
jgi:exodeoxyribonuclease V gamma subunit